MKYYNERAADKKKKKKKLAKGQLHQAGEDKTSAITLKSGPTPISDLMADDQSLTRCSLRNCSSLSLFFVRYDLCSYQLSLFLFFCLHQKVYSVLHFQEITCILHLIRGIKMMKSHALLL